MRMAARPLALSQKFGGWLFIILPIAVLVPNARANGAASPEVREESVKQRMPGPTVGRLHPCAERGDGRRKRHLPGPVFRAGRGDPALFRTDTGKIA